MDDPLDDLSLPERPLPDKVDVTAALPAPVCGCPHPMYDQDMDTCCKCGRLLRIRPEGGQQAA